MLRIKSISTALSIQTNWHVHLIIRNMMSYQKKHVLHFEIIFCLGFFLKKSAWALPIPPLSCVTLKTADWGLSCIRIGLSLSPCPWIPFAIFFLFQYRGRYTETVSERHTRENTESVRALQHVEAGLYCVYFLFLWSLLSSILKKKVQDLCNCNACCDFSRLMASWISLNYFGQSRLKQVTKQRTIPPPPPLTPTPSYNTIHNLTHHREANTFSTIWQIIRRKCFYQSLYLLDSLRWIFPNWHCACHKSLCYCPFYKLCYF